MTLLFKKPLNAQFLCTVCLYIDIRNRIDGLHIVLDMVKKRICKTVNRVEKITQQTAQREKKIEIQTRLRNREELYSTSHWSSRRKHWQHWGKEVIFKEIMAENFPRLMKDDYPWVQEAHKILNRVKKIYPHSSH